MNKERKIELIKDAFGKFNHNIESEAIYKILNISCEAIFNKNDMILNMLDEQCEIYIISSGLVRSYYIDDDGNDISKFFMGENDFCIGESLFSDGKSIEAFEALEDVYALKFNAKKLKKVILENSQLTSLYVKFLEENLIYKMNREYSFQAMSATERYINFKRQYKNLEKRINQRYIASYIGIAPESLSRIKRTIKEEN